MAKEINWEALEKRVRTVASYIWNCHACKDTIAGVRCDAVLKLEPDQWVLIEVTKSATLTKLRTDLGKFAAVKPALMADGIYAKCFFVCAKPPTASLVETGKGNKVEVLSVNELERRFFDYDRYHHARSNRRFGSAVDPISGDRDRRPYVPVQYQESRRDEYYTVEDLAKITLGGRNIILLGSYGTGKSRCVQEVFLTAERLRQRKHVYPIAIDLRDNWGLCRGTEILRRHFDEIGQSGLSDGLLRVLDKRIVCLLLDGFDEIVSQVWSDDPAHLEKIRFESLQGVRDLITRARAGLLITGREHYFNSEEEMLCCLGLEREQVLIVTCAEEFSEEQMSAYLGRISPGLVVPKWLPRRPLVSRILVSLDPGELGALLTSEDGEIGFWHRLLDAICEREAGIHPSLEPSTIRSVLLELANVSRTKPRNLGPISLSEMNQAFERVVGKPPRDEASAMLQRLPLLGRVESETADRQFLDTYVLDALRATALIEAISVGGGDALLNRRWMQPLGDFGRCLLSQHIVSTNAASLYLSLLRRTTMSVNRTLAGDLLSALLATETGKLDFGGLTVSGSDIGTLDFQDTKARNLNLESCLIDELRISQKVPSNITIRESEIQTVRGLSAVDPIPPWIRDTKIKRFDTLTSVARIRRADLTREQKIFVTIVHKVFFQAGGGRKEEALLRGLGESGDRRVARRIIGFLLEDRIIETFPGREGSVYTPVRKHTRRMGKILSQLRHSHDPLWLRLKDKGRK